MLKQKIVKLLKTTDKETFREKSYLTHRGKTIYMTAYFFSETMEDKKKWHTIFQMLKGKICQPRKFITSENIFQEIRSNQAILRKEN